MDGAQFVLKDIKRPSISFDYETKYVRGELEVFLRESKRSLVRYVKYTPRDSDTETIIPIRTTNELDLPYMMLREISDKAIFADVEDVESPVGIAVSFKSTPWIEDKRYLALSERDKYNIYLRNRRLQIHKNDTECPLCGCDFDSNELFVCSECGSLMSKDCESMTNPGECIYCNKETE